MSKYTLEAKHSLRLKAYDPIGIKEYMVYHDEPNNTRFIVVKLLNQSAKKIDQAILEIHQFDSMNALIQKSVHRLDELNIQAFKSIVPLEKIEILSKCVRIEAVLIEATSSEQTWKADNWHGSNHVKTETVDENPLQITEIESKKFGFPFHYVWLFVVLYVVLVAGVFFLINR